MPELMIKCSETGKPVSTGITVNGGLPETTLYQGNSLQCPYCGEVHEWTIGEVRWEDHDSLSQD